MQINERQLLSFIEIYKETFGVALSRSEAHDKASLLLQYALLCIKPLAKAEDGDIINGSNESE